MNKQSIESKFSADIDSYLDGIEELSASSDQEYNELFKIGQLLAKRDFSKKVNKNYIYNKCLQKIKEGKGESNMKKIRLGYKVAAAALAFTLVGGSFMQTAFAKDLSCRITKVISFGRIGAVQIKDTSKKSEQVPKELIGKIFDKNGKPITKYTKENRRQLYTSNGEKIVAIKDGQIQTEAQLEVSTGRITDINNINKYSCFKVSIPEYIPQGYKFDHADIYKGDNGEVWDKAILICLKNDKNGDCLYASERLDCPDAQYYDGGKTIQKIKINNVDAVLIDGNTINWTANKCIYSVFAHQLTTDEIKKVAESIK